MACAWARKKLYTPWCLHLDLYGEMYGMNISDGKSRPDLIALSPNGDWVVIECKGYSIKPRRHGDKRKCPIEKAKNQSKRVTSIGGIKPNLRIASFSFFGKNPDASPRHSHIGKSQIVQMNVYDPPEGDDENSEVELGANIDLPKWTHGKYLLDYYRPWISHFQKEKARIDGAQTVVNYSDIGISIKMNSKLLKILQKISPIQNDSESILERVSSSLHQGDTKGSILNEGGIGDGIEIEVDERWKNLGAVVATG